MRRPNFSNSQSREGGARAGNKGWWGAGSKKIGNCWRMSRSETWGETIWESVDIVCAAVHIQAQIPVECDWAEWWWWSTEWEAMLNGTRLKVIIRIVQRESVMYCLVRIILDWQRKFEELERIPLKNQWKSYETHQCSVKALFSRSGSTPRNEISIIACKSGSFELIPIDISVY